MAAIVMPRHDLAPLFVFFIVEILFTCIFPKYLELPYQALYCSVEDILVFPVMCHMMGLHANKFTLFLYQRGKVSQIFLLYCYFYDNYIYILVN